MILLVVFHTWFYLSSVALAQNKHGKFKSTIHLPTAVKESGSLNQSQCFSSVELLDTKDKIRYIIDDIFPCGGSTGWTRVVHLNMTDPSHQCPLNLTLVNTTIRGCGRLQPNGVTCDSVKYPIHNRHYSTVCGRIVAYQRGQSAAFYRTLAFDAPLYNDLESAYVSGVSLTHGRPGSRQHIWTFAGAGYEQGLSYSANTRFTCSCTNTNLPWPHTVPSFVGNDYFCETGNRGPGYSYDRIYQDDPLWDGKGCGPTSTCCEFNHPPWMFKTLPYTTTDDVEIRLCPSTSAHNQEDKIITLIELYVK